MWIEQRDGKAKYNERFKDELTGRYKKLSVTLDKDTAHNRKLASKMLADKWAAINKVGVRYKLSEVFDRYLEDCKKVLKESTWRRNVANAKRIQNFLGTDIYVDKLTAGYIRDKLIATKKAPGTLNEYLKRFKTVIKWAYYNDYIASTACIDKLQNFKDTPHRQKIADKFLNKSDLHKLVDAASVPHWELLIRFMVLSGCRSGEAIALDVKDIDFDEKSIHIYKTCDAISGKITTPKTSDSIRDIHMQPELYTLCRQIISHSRRMRMLNVNSDKDPFFLTDKGQRPRYAAFNTYLRNLTYRIFGRRLTTHALRHTAASLWAEQGMSLEAISRRLGHSDSSITKEIYLHVTDGMEAADAAEADRMVLF